jgi:surfeit locus 1 family protein
VSHARVRRAGLLWPSAAALVGLAVLLSLGSWQLGRLQWKRDLLATIQARATGAVVGNAGWAASGCAEPRRASDICEFRRMRLTGRFRHDGERHIFIHVDRLEPGVGGTGYWVFTPFELSAPARGTIYVNRGFVPLANKDAATRGGATPAGEVTVEGLARRPEARAWFTAANDPVKNVWFLRDPREFQGTNPDPDVVLTAYLDQSGARAAGVAGPVPAGGKIEIANRHLEYALTWFGLAATLVGVFIAFALGRLKNSA